MASMLMLYDPDPARAVASVVRYRPARLVVLVPVVDGRPNPSAATGYSMLSQILAPLGAHPERLDVETGRVGEAVARIRDKMLALASTPPLLIDTAVQPDPLLLTETLLAAITLPPQARKHARLILHSPKGDTVLDHEALAEILSGRPPLTPAEQAVLEAIQPGETYTLKQIHQLLTQKGYTATKQYTMKLLRRLEEKGYVTRLAHGLYTRNPY